MAKKEKDSKKSKKKAVRLKDDELFKIARKFQKAKQRVAKYTKEWRDDQKLMLGELHEARKLKSLTNSEGETITVVQASSLVYDGPGLWKILKPKQRRAVFTENINLNALPDDARKRVIAALTTEERKAVTSHSLNPDLLAAEVQAGNISAEVVAKYSEIKYNEPYISFSQGSGS